MKKVLVYLLAIFFLVSSLGHAAYSLEKNTESIKVNVYINDMRLPITKAGNNHYIKINDLKEFGFDVKEDKGQKIINIYQNPNLIVKPIEVDDYITESFSVTNTKYEVYINDCAVQAKQIKHDIVIDINSFINVKGFNYEKWNDKDNSCDIYITNSDGVVNAFTSADKTKIHLTRRGNYLYSESKKIGLIQDNMEWISLDYIKERIDFDEIEEEKDEDRIWIYLEKGNYEVEIQVRDAENADAECGRFYMELTAIPFELNGELYLSLADSVQLFNLDITRDFEIKNNEVKGIGYGNSINGLNIIKNNDWFYYINRYDSESLYRSKQDMSERNKIIDRYVDQFYIYDKEIYYIGYDNEDKEGIYKVNLDGTNQKQIVSGKASFLNILGNKLYYCEGLDGGNLYEMDLNGNNKKMLIEGSIAYPNINNGWIYYINLEDNSSIYRVKLDGTYNIKINNMSANCLNVDSEKVYFSDSYNSYSMNHDGSFKIKLFDESANNILLSQNNIYWDCYDVYKQDKDSILSDLVNKDPKIIGIGLENDRLITLLENKTMSFQRYDISSGENEVIDIEDGYRIEEVQYPYIYYKLSNGKLVKYNINTKSSEIIVSEMFSKVLNIIDDWIYYEAWGDDLYRVKNDGTNNMKLLDSNIYDVHIDSSGIYYLISKSELTIEECCKVNLDGTNKQILIDDLIADYAFTSQVYKDYIYYQNDGLYRIKKDGTDKKKVIDKPTWTFKIMGDHIYYCYQGDLYSAECDGSKQEKIIEDIGYSFTKYKDSIFYFKEDEEHSELFRYNLTSKHSEQVPNMKFTEAFLRFMKEKDNHLIISCSMDEGFAEVMSYYLLDMDTNNVKVLQDKIENCYIYNEDVFVNDGYLYYIKDVMELKFIIE